MILSIIIKFLIERLDNKLASMQCSRQATLPLDKSEFSRRMGGIKYCAISAQEKVVCMAKAIKITATGVILKMFGLTQT